MKYLLMICREESVELTGEGHALPGRGAEPRRRGRYGRRPCRRGAARGGTRGSPLSDYYLLHATRGDLLRRLGRTTEAAGSYRRALELVGSDAERRFLVRRLAEVKNDDGDR